MGAIVGVLLLVWLFALAFGILTYVLQSLGVYTIAKRRGINNSWLAWIPVGSSWMLGCISDQYQYVAKGQVKSKRKVLLGLNIVSMILAVVVFACSIWAVVANVAFFADESGDVYEDYFEDDYYYFEDDYYYYEDDYDFSSEEIMAMGEAAMPIMVVYGCSTIASVISLIAMIFLYIALFDLFRSCDPNNGVLFLVLSIFFSVAQPFLIFACRNKDDGMPPRRDQMFQQPNQWQPPVQSVQPAVWQPPVQQPAQPPAWQPPQPPVEPWENNTEE